MTTQNRISLHELVSQLMTGLLPSAVKRGSLILNDIPRELSLSTDENMLAYVLFNLMDSAISATQDGCIHVVADAAEGHTTIRVTDMGSCFYRSISQNYRQLQWVAEKIGGTISLEDGKSETHVSFSIANNLLAA